MLYLHHSIREYAKKDEGKDLSIADTLALLPLVKRQVFCVGDRLKMDKHKATLHIVH